MTTTLTLPMTDPSKAIPRAISRFFATAVRRANPWSIGITLIIGTLGVVFWMNTDGAVKMMEAASEVKTIKRDLQETRAAHMHCHEELNAVKAEVKDLKTKLNITASQ